MLFFIYTFKTSVSTSLVDQPVTNLPAVQEVWVQSLGWEDTLEKGVATQKSCLGSRTDSGAWWAI